MPAPPLSGASYRSVIYVGQIGNRELKVYVLEGSDPPYVMTVAWKGEDI
jgi:hypothetical protein